MRFVVYRPIIVYATVLLGVWRALADPAYNLPADYAQRLDATATAFQHDALVLDDGTRLAYHIRHGSGPALADRHARPLGMVVCGGAALIATGLHRRTTTGVDIVALVDHDGSLVSPAPLPDHLLHAADQVGRTQRLLTGWLNNGPSRDAGGLFQMGLPAGFQGRLHARAYGTHLTVYFIDRLDQIHFKLYAAVDRGGYHINDLEILKPTDEELIAAAR